MTFDIEFLRKIRQREIAQLVKYIKPGQRVLEIGAGAGWQSQSLSELGLKVIAVDLPGTMYAAHAVCPIIQYDGRSLPLVDQSVDVVYSSNVLEHIPHVREYQSELLRVLRPGGRALHFLPTPAWRFWTLIALYIELVQRQIRKLRVQNLSEAVESRSTTGEPNEVSPSWPGISRRFYRALVPERHGEFGNSITELYYFSQFRWKRLFEETGWLVEHIEPGELFYTGEMLFGDGLTFSMRGRLSKILGSACALYVLRSRTTQ